MIEIDLRTMAICIGGGVLNLLLSCALVSADLHPVRALMASGSVVAGVAAIVEETTRRRNG